MKKTLIIMLSIAVLFAFASCDNTNDKAPALSSDDLELAQGAYKAAVTEINKNPTTSSNKDDLTVDGYDGYTVSYTYTHTDERWDLEISAEKEGYKMEFTISSDSGTTITVTINDDPFTVGKVDIKNKVFITGVDTDDPEYDNPEQDPPEEDDSEQDNPEQDNTDTDEEGTNDPPEEVI